MIDMNRFNKGLPKTFGLYTLGCKVNQYETQLIREKLFNAGLKEPQAEMADIYVVNTCTVTHKADKESWRLVRRLHRRNPSARIFVTGCSAENRPESFRAIEGVSRAVGNNQKEHLIDFILPHLGQAGSQAAKNSITEFQKHTRAFLKIQDGCNNGCSYCIVPKVRGSSRSRPLNLIEKEAQDLVSRGYKEIVLCGICLGAYGRDLKPRLSLVRVIETLEKIKGLLRIRLSSIEASDIDSALIDKMTNSGKLCRHLHIPFQSGDDKILKLMNRKLKSGDYLKLLCRIRRASPDIAITTDIMAGFPQEDEKSFNNTIKFLKKAKPSRMHIFHFSPRRNTAAFNLRIIPDGEVVKKRAGELKRVSKELACEFYKKFIGKSVSVLVESEIDLEAGLYKGYSGNYIKVYLSSKRDIRNNLVKAKILRSYRDGVLASGYSQVALSHK